MIALIILFVQECKNAIRKPLTASYSPFNTPDIADDELYYERSMVFES